MMDWARTLKAPPKTHEERFNQAVQGGISIMNQASQDPNLQENWAYYSGQFYGATLPVLDKDLVEAGFAYAFGELLGGAISRIPIKVP